MNRFIFSTIFILVNINLISCDDNVRNVLTPISIDVDLRNIKSEDFDIIKSVIDIDPNDEVKLESYKLTPKTNKKINKVTFGDTDLWNTEVSTECLNITIHNRKYIYFIIKTLENNVPAYIYLRLNHSFIGITGVLSLLYDINYPFLSHNVSKPYPLNISSNFDKVYANYLFKQKGRYRYETFEPNEGETFGMVTDNIDIIWVPTESLIRRVGMGFCIKVRVFKEETYVRDRNDGRLKSVLVYRFLILSLIDGRREYLKLDPETDKWVNIEIKELRMGIRRFVGKGLYYFGSGESSASDDESDKNEPFVLDIFKRNEKLTYGISNVYPFRVINIYKSDTTRINEIRYRNQLILKCDFSMFIMNIFNTRNEWYYVEIVIKSERDLTKDNQLYNIYLSKLGPELYGIYYRIYDRNKEFENITRNYFLDSLESYISEQADTDYVKYSNFYELEGGLEESDLSEEILLKINPNYREDRLAVPAEPVTTDDQADDTKPEDLTPPNPEGPPDGPPDGPPNNRPDGPPNGPEGQGGPPPSPGATPPSTSTPGSTKNTPPSTTTIVGSTPPSGNDTNGNDDPPNDFSKNDESNSGSNGKEHDEVEDSKVYEKVKTPSESSTIKNEGDDKYQEHNKASEKGNDIAVPEQSPKAPVVVQKVVGFVKFFGFVTHHGENEHSLRFASKLSGFISSISRLSILIIITSMLI